ncbi:MAG: Gfo/Idh/MocA family protein [Fermentimonas sp.]|jgi:predicted dehydrogenase
MINRREFIKRAAIGSTLLTVPHSFIYMRDKMPSSNIQIALIGAGGMGTSDTITALSIDGIKLVGVCDLYDKRLEESKKRWGEHLFITKDYREILALDSVDAVIIATPDHWHHAIAMDAMKAGKHVYCEKPIIHKLYEGQELIDAQRQSKTCFQIGSQGMASVGNKIAKVIIQNGVIGKVNRVDGQFTSAPSPLQPYNPPVDATPESIWWKQFLGNAPDIPFDAQKFFAWRKWKDYGTTIAGDLFVHVISSIHFIMDARGPEKVYTTGGIHHYTDGSRDTPDIMLGYLDYPDQNDLGAFTLSMGANYVDGISKKWGSTNFNIIGSKGTLQVGWNEVTLKTTYELDESQIIIGDQVGPHLGTVTKVSPNEYTFYAVEGYRGGHYHHFLNFFDGIRHNSPIVADVTFGVCASAPALLCYESYLREEAIRWDSHKLMLKEI